MITNERQYRISKQEAQRFREAIKGFDELSLIKQGIDPIIAAAQRMALVEQLSEIEQELSRYEDLQDGILSELALKNVSGVGDVLIQARVARGLSQKELAERLGMKEQQIQRYEQERYLSANLIRVSEVADALHINLKGYFDLSADQFAGAFQDDARGKIFNPANLPHKLMKKRGWLKTVDVPASIRSAPDIDLAAEFINQAFEGSDKRAFLKQHVRSGGKYDPYSLLAWKARILQKARWTQPKLVESLPDGSFVRRLVELSAVEDGVVQAVFALREQGITVVFEERLPATHLDGAAMLLDKKFPVIGMTLRHDRLDNFWFVLLHEFAHVVRHRDQGLTDGFFDDEEIDSEDPLELEADEFARNALISDEVWKASFARFAKTESQVISFARKHNISPAVVSGRIRRERGYNLFSNLIGRGLVKAKLASAGLLGD